jgi:hypothetical protein
MGQRRPGFRWTLNPGYGSTAPLDPPNSRCEVRHGTCLFDIALLAQLR